MNPSWNAETTARISVAIIGCAATPALVGFAHLRWTGGLASEVIISVLWLFQTTLWILWSLHYDLTTPYGNWREFELFLPVFYFLAALLLACALKGASRLLMIAAWVLMQLYYRAFIYI
jgi:hypothetical protein